MVMFWGESKVACRFLTAQGSGPLSPAWSKGQVNGVQWWLRVWLLA